jgi:FkbM family methyltransferase
VRSLFGLSRWLINFGRHSGVEHRWHLVACYLQLRVLACVPRWRRNLHVLGYEIAYPSAEAMRWIFGEIFINRDYEIAPDSRVERIVDAGANIGLAAIYFRDAYPDAEIICFEPDPRAYEYLVRNIEHNKLKNVEARHLGLADGRDTATLYVNATKQDTRQSLSPEFATARADGGATRRIEVQTAPLGEEVTGSIDILKVDVEGSELKLLRGAGDLLSTVRHVVMEYHQLPDNPLHKVLEILADAGHVYEIAAPLSAEFGTVTVIRTGR